jgi:hypothetical protein
MFSMLPSTSAARQRLGRIALQAQLALAGIGQLDQAHAGALMSRPTSGGLPCPNKELD